MSELLDFKMSSYMEIGGIVFVNITESNFKPNFLSRFFLMKFQYLIAFQFKTTKIYQYLSC